MIKNCNHVHFVGIGGVGMSALAEWMHKQGKKVTGSDRAKSVYTNKLMDIGVKIDFSSGKNLMCGCDFVIVNSAISFDNDELVFAKQSGIPVFSRSDLLGVVFDSFSKNVAVCGMHGKTTTTGMISHCLSVSKQRPTAFVGGVCNNFKSNFLSGDSEYCVAEACEYKANFLSMHPYITCMLNIDLDHTDFYKDLDHVKQTFLQFAKNTKAGGTLVVNGDQNQLKDFCNQLKDLGCVTFGFDEGNSYRATNLVCVGGKYTFCVVKHGRFCCEVSLSVYGKHNVLNALCVFATLDLLGIPKEMIKQGLKTFDGVDRRFSIFISTTNVIVDYAHHPNEIKAFLQTANSMGFDKIFLVFQPHTYTRTQSLFDDFVEVLDGDEIFVLPTFAARENKINGCDGRDIVSGLKNKNKKATFCKNKKLLAKKLLKKAKPNDAILLVGAGDVDEMKDLLL